MEPTFKDVLRAIMEIRTGRSSDDPRVRKIVEILKTFKERNLLSIDTDIQSDRADNSLHVEDTVFGCFHELTSFH